MTGNIRAYLYRVADNCIKHNLESHNKYYAHVVSTEEKEEAASLIDAGYLDDYFGEHAEIDTMHIAIETLTE